MLMRHSVYDDMTVLCKMFCPQEYVQRITDSIPFFFSFVSTTVRRLLIVLPVCRFKTEMMKLAQDTTAGATNQDTKMPDTHEEEEEPI
jgi:hypothetical protein